MWSNSGQSSWTQMVLWPPPFLSLSHPLQHKQSKLWLRPIMLLLCHLGTLQSLAPHNSALACHDGRLLSSVYIFVPCPQVRVEQRNESWYHYNISSGLYHAFQFTVGMADLCIIFHCSIYMPPNVGEALSADDCCFFEWLLVSLFYFNIS